ncbi:MAG: alpha/beta hydrolase [Pseudomonadota bacterium]
MPILRLNAGENGLVLHGSPAAPLPAIISAARGTGPVIVMIHGFKYDPDHLSCDPHATIFARQPHPGRTDKVPWPRHLGFGMGHEDEGLAIAFGWRARGNIWRAQRSASAAGRHLAEVIDLIRSVAPRRAIHLISHSMGSEVVFDALHALPARSVDRIIALTGASYQRRATEAMQTDAGRSAELINVLTRENDLFDALFECIMPAGAQDKAMGSGLDLPNAVNLQLDCHTTLDHLSDLGAPIAASQRICCHWSGYTRPGALRFYNAALRDVKRLSLPRLHAGVPNGLDPRWSRFLPRFNHNAAADRFEKAI